MQLFYHPNATTLLQEIFFSKEESKHIIKVLRKNVGDTLDITNGKGSFFTAEITQANSNTCFAKITAEFPQKPLPYHLHLAVAPTKLNDRFEWFLEKATEIGISEITPIFCERSERKYIKPERFEKIIQSAMKQSLKGFLPILHPAISFKEFVLQQKNTPSKKYIAHCEDTDRKSLKNEIKAKDSIVILIGPEGDFSEKEIAFAHTNSFIAVTLGESRLRTETAAVVACHSVAFVNE
ncbi:MAG: 16S rRNA (uracil(1498)-N(3))-methyltransferase [Flavobacteriaceae bacterium CG_4_8_14_3_um_filter_34_10]|nr:16S rRNA (uracil(1498)-N(3))-methyltransferase [Flavobacteriia bacterium]OIP49129.1 MAG: 16S rRNA (uracil(1498)-N(3))-methyltransferase [Flavobacteriaceae bacterium CG2_30_34_30]PIQ19484.1 MAG: 16S rRNA (uracil(1498)-N(3))-methyltransferase [Flavobacteriaceae bacterium CG18_big_fil_WC_8_21_14_2_50_34_36]PIV51073.1 MAG: 16S rRNA (uracil(1498)-N(3))-methyltransferase [Flavobacteriaceae bacterium CG02_land_8_20_14_3_00_34_13]PIX10483.1 MAG: 16S rRNA (uracil(1498)-N(3))-methyltransferase [Flavob